MTIKTKSETMFEEFCNLNKLRWQKIPERNQPTPDYKVTLNTQTIIFEVKQIDKDENFTETAGTRTVGNHVRARINEARNQIKAASREQFPAILLIYNNLDPMQIFGTESHDFITAMYGEITIELSSKDHGIIDSYHGRNQSLRENKNTSFSAIGWLHQTNEGPAVRIYENVFAEYKLNYASPPKCVEAIRVELE